MQTIKQFPKLTGERVLVRVDYNVPLSVQTTRSKILDARRIESSYKTLDTLLKKGASPVLLAHLGKDGTQSLRPIATFLSKRYKIVFVENDVFDDRTKDILDSVPKGTIILLENIRRYEGEEQNDKAFAKRLAQFGKYYVNDAFSVSHRAHASVVGLPKLLPSFVGYQLEAEIQALTPVIEVKKHPFLFILGGAKFSTKIPLLKRFVETADSVIIAGAILNNFYKVLGFETGDSRVEEGYEGPIKKLLKNPKVLLPVDVLVLREVNGKMKKVAVLPTEVEKGDIIADIGAESAVLIAQKIAKAKLIVWNGPTGWYEKGFTKATIDLAKAIQRGNASTVIGGGDTGAVIEKVVEGENKKIFISTGGGATLEFLAKGTLPGIKALETKK